MYFINNADIQLIFDFVRETLSWACFKDNFALVKNKSMYSSKIDTLHSMGLFNLYYATYLAIWLICHILHHRHVFFCPYMFE